MAFVDVRSVSKSYPGKVVTRPVLNDVSISLQKGDFCALTGSSGSGKSTLMNLIGLLDRADKGDIFFDGVGSQNLSDEKTAFLRNRLIGFVFQSFHLLPHLSLGDNVSLPLLYRGIPGRRRRDRAIEALEQVGLSGRHTDFPDMLSGGQRQRVAIARALVGSPGLLLADEPTGNLDSQSAGEILDLFFHLNKTLNVTVLVVTHDEKIASRCFRCISIKDGSLVVEKGNQT